MSDVFPVTKTTREHWRGYHDHHTEPGCPVCKWRVAYLKEHGPVPVVTWDEKPGDDDE